MNTSSRRDVLTGIGAAGAIAVVGPAPALADDDTDDQGDGGTVEVRVGHLSPDTPAVDVYVGAPELDPTDENTDPVVEGLEYPNFAHDAGGTYLDLEPGTYDISVTVADDPETEPIDVDGFEFEPNRDYTILAVGELDPEPDEPEIQALPLVDNGDEETALPPADATLVRLVHASPDAPAVDVTVASSGDPLFDGVPFKESGYVSVGAGDYTAQIRPDTDANDGQIAYEADVSLDGGTVYTAFASGYLSPDDEPTDEAFELSVVQDASY